jgi:wobble nucleotide-excising tRNase
MTEEQKVHEDGRCQNNKCPFCALSEIMKDCMSNYESFFGHLKNAEAEVLKAVRSLIDQRLADTGANSAKKPTKIKVD